MSFGAYIQPNGGTFFDGPVNFTSPVTIDGNPFQTCSSGSWSPTIVNTTNINNPVTVDRAVYTQVGNVVWVALSLRVATNADNTLTIFQISNLPVARSHFSTTMAVGNGLYIFTTQTQVAVNVSQATSPVYHEVRWFPTAGASLNVPVEVTYSYNLTP